MKIWSLIVALAVIAAGAGGFLAGRRGISFPQSSQTEPAEAHGHGDAHGHEHHDENSNVVHLSDQARENLGLKLGEIKTSEFWRTISVPGVVAEKPGHSERRITTAVNGVIIRVHVSTGQTVRPGDALFDVQSTGELLTNAQANLLKTLQDLELAEIELKRLEPLAEQGSIPGSRVIEKKYERQRLEALRLVQMQELVVRGLSTDQISQITTSKTLLRQFTVRVPGAMSPPPSTATHRSADYRVVPASLLKFDATMQEAAEADLVYSVEEIDVFPGKLVQPGDALCDLGLHNTLRLIGMGFQRESQLIANVLEEQRPVTAVFETGESEDLIRTGLKIQYADNVVDPKTRLFRFYLPLKNEVARDLNGPDGVNFRSWRFKPGQRVQLQVPVEHWTEKIVLPTEAVVKEGAEAYVFRANGKLLERVAVSIIYEDARHIVIAKNKKLWEGDLIAFNEAYQLNLALKKSQGSGVDLHAGHHH